MRTFDLLSPEKIVESVEELKRTARTYHDINYWLQEHIRNFGISPPNENEDVVADITYSHIDWSLSTNIEAISTTATVSIIVANNTNNDNAFNKALNIKEVLNSAQKSEFIMAMPYKEWPLLTASLLLGRLQGVLLCEKAELDDMDRVIEKYLPYHFDGITYDMMKSLYAADLLPRDNLNNLDAPAVLDMLYKRREQKLSLVLPDTIYVEESPAP